MLGPKPLTRESLETFKMQALASVCLRSPLLLEPAALIDKTLSMLFGGTGHLNICQRVVDRRLESL